MISSTFSYGFSGLQTAYQGMTRSAQDIASANTVDAAGVRDSATEINAGLTGTADTNTALISLKQNLHLFDASARVVSTADQQIGSLLDITA
ncbi:hypothetical protein QGM61_03500 [Pseudohongiella sp. SYSU M77423]|uniref:hypothetical protein n=1 Tax=Pseudohongiella sp. SYSU M77423 TaxID=3042312 RepID=UPI0024808F97|nr:hypothetical protein [Pseudohongiella sp. SYSU M77423]MDH7942877.1 hypothetical protein [Pseudohongiella sp. SYSU M77423]